MRVMRYCTRKFRDTSKLKLNFWRGFAQYTADVRAELGAALHIHNND